MRQPLSFKQLCVKMSVGYDVYFHNMGLHKDKPIVHLHIN